jgi:hypothetical protein
LKKILLIILINFTIVSFGQKEKNENIKPNDYRETNVKTDTISKSVYLEKIIKTKPNSSKLEKNPDKKNEISEYLKSKWIELLGLLIAVLAFFIPIYKYLSQKREEQKDKRFVTYHQLIADLVNPPGGKLDRQIATVFELRNFPNYFDLTERIMTHLTNQWSGDVRNQRLITELNLTVNYIKKMSKWYNKLVYKIFGIK